MPLLIRVIYYFVGCNNLIVAVDHKLPLKVFGDLKLANQKNPHLLNFNPKTLPNGFQIIHIPSRKHQAANTILSNLSGLTDTMQMLLTDDTHTPVTYDDHDNCKSKMTSQHPSS